MTPNPELGRVIGQTQPIPNLSYVQDHAVLNRRNPPSYRDLSRHMGSQPLPYPHYLNQGQGYPHQTQTLRDMSHLLGSSKVPKLPSFLGPGKGETTYKERRYQVRCLINDPKYTETDILGALSVSLSVLAKLVTC